MRRVFELWMLFFFSMGLAIFFTLVFLWVVSGA